MIFHQHEQFTLYHGDCFKLDLPQVDAVVVDPPYGIGHSNKKGLSMARPSKKWPNGSLRDYGTYNWDTARLDQLPKLAFGLTSNVNIFGGNYYADLLPAAKGWVVWDKYTTGNFADCELMYTSTLAATRLIRYMWNGFQKERSEKRYHLTQKPVEVMRQVLRMVTKPGDVVLDMCMGSGTTGVACMHTGRRFIGVDIEQDYCEIAKSRILNAAGEYVPLPRENQPLLFQNETSPED